LKDLFVVDRFVIPITLSILLLAVLVPITQLKYF